MAKKTGKKKRNPQDATLRNVRALKKRVNELEERVNGITDMVTQTYADHIVALQKKVANLETAVARE